MQINKLHFQDMGCIICLNTITTGWTHSEYLHVLLKVRGTHMCWRTVPRCDLQLGKIQYRTLQHAQYLNVVVRETTLCSEIMLHPEWRFVRTIEKKILTKFKKLSAVVCRRSGVLKFWFPWGSMSTKTKKKKSQKKVENVFFFKNFQSIWPRGKQQLKFQAWLCLT